MKKQHGLSKHPVYNRWNSMVQRCTNKNNVAYKNYGERGIAIDSRWLDFRNFLSDMGLPDEGMTLERINNDKGYCRENCIWANRKCQSQNRRNVKKYELNGQFKSLVDWADFYGIKLATLWARINNGMTLEEAICKPVSSSRSRSKFFVYEGEKVTLGDLSKRFGIKKGTIISRLRRGFDIESATKKPLNQFLTTYKNTRGRGRCIETKSC